MKPPFNRALSERMRFIDMLLDHYGHFQRATVADYFGLSIPQASLDIRMYIRLTENMIDYNKSTKRYERTEHYKRTWS